MCVACVEYNKGKLTQNEFRSALREMTVEQQEHFEAVNRILKEFDGQPDEIKKRLAELND
jgi:ferritin-like protein